MSNQGASSSDSFDNYYTEVSHWQKCTNVIHFHNFNRFYVNINACCVTNCHLQVKKIEARDSVLTSEQQINRLLRAGSTYFNLNPFEVLQIEPNTPIEQIKKKYRSLSFLVHPDKNQDNQERAQLAFEAVSKAWKTLENDVTRKRCLDIYEEAKERTDHMVILAQKQNSQLLLINCCSIV